MLGTTRQKMIVVAIVVIVLGIINLAGVFAPVQSETNEIATPDEFEEELPPAESELAEDVGGISSVTGIAVLAVGIAMIGIGIGLLGNQPWDKTLLIVLVIDIFLKSINIVIQIMMDTDRSFGNYSLALGIMAVEALVVVSIILFKRYYESFNEPAKV